MTMLMRRIVNQSITSRMNNNAKPKPKQKNQIIIIGDELICE